MKATPPLANVDNRGIPPLAGLCSYAEAADPGMSVEDTVRFIKRLAYVKGRLNKLLAAHLAKTPEWEVKSALGLHLWLDAEHAGLLRKRVSEMRQPPLGLDKVPDDRLEVWVDEAIRANDTVELLTGVYRVVRPELIRSARCFLDVSNPILDYPTRRVIALMLQEEEQMMKWGRRAVEAVCATPEGRAAASAWEQHLQAFLHNSGGVFEDDEYAGPTSMPPTRSDGAPFKMDPTPCRDDRFSQPFNLAAPIDKVYVDTEAPVQERVLALLAKRLREIDVPEWMAPIIYKTDDKPWDYYVDLSRQLWDETRHAMMGEVGFVTNGVPFYSYPINMTASYVLNTTFLPIEAHAILWAIEQSLMARKTGKGYEWDVAVQSGDCFAIAVQDYDWADEVLHAQIGRRWLIPDIGSQTDLKSYAAPAIERWRSEVDALTSQHFQEDWWPAFVADVRAKGHSR